jgi:hypothetical protein
MAEINSAAIVGASTATTADTAPAAPSTATHASSAEKSAVSPRKDSDRKRRRSSRSKSRSRSRSRSSRRKTVDKPPSRSSRKHHQPSRSRSRDRKDSKREKEKDSKRDKEKSSKDSKDDNQRESKHDKEKDSKLSNDARDQKREQDSKDLKKDDSGSLKQSKRSRSKDRSGRKKDTKESEAKPATPAAAETEPKHDDSTMKDIDKPTKRSEKSTDAATPAVSSITYAADTQMTDKQSSSRRRSRSHSRSRARRSRSRERQASRDVHHRERSRERSARGYHEYESNRGDYSRDRHDYERDRRREYDDRNYRGSSRARDRDSERARERDRRREPSPPSRDRGAPSQYPSQRARGPPGIMSTSRVCVKSLHPSVTTEMLQKAFEPFGELRDCVVLRIPSGESRCMGFVEYSTAAECQAAFAELNGKDLHGRPIVLEYARLRESDQVKFQPDRLALFNLPIYSPNPSFTPRSLQDVLVKAFEQYGKVVEVIMVGKGRAFVQFERKSDAREAMSKQNEQIVEGLQELVGPDVKVQPTRVELARRRENDMPSTDANSLGRDERESDRDRARRPRHREGAPAYRDVCRFWGSVEGCSEGDACRFIHPADVPAKAEVSSKTTMAPSLTSMPMPPLPGGMAPFNMTFPMSNMPLGMGVNSMGRMPMPFNPMLPMGMSNMPMSMPMPMPMPPMMTGGGGMPFNFMNGRQQPMMMNGGGGGGGMNNFRSTNLQHPSQSSHPSSDRHQAPDAVSAAAPSEQKLPEPADEAVASEHDALYADLAPPSS